MIRANLLPRSRRTLRAGAFAVDAALFRDGLAGLALVVLVASLGAGIGEMRLHRVEVAAARDEREIADLEPGCAESKHLALDVAHFQEFAREARHYRRSGADAATAIARIGNGMPDGTWLDALSHSPAGFELTGEASAVGPVGDAIARLANVLPSASASLVSLDNRSADGIHFDARLTVTTP